MNGEVIHPLFGLFDQRVPENLPSQFFRFSVHFLQGLIDGNGSDGYRRVADDPLPGLMNILTRGEVHDRVGTPVSRPDHLLHLFLNRGGNGRVADVGVDLDQEITPDDHRFHFSMVDIGRNNGSPTGHLFTHELGCNHARNPCSPGVPWMLTPETVV